MIRLLLLAALLPAPKPLRLASPDGKIVFTFSPQTGYTVTYKGKPLVDASKLNLYFKDQSLLVDKTTKPGRPTYTTGTDDYTLVVGKTGKVHDQYNQLTLPLTSAHTINLEVRAFNDGLAFRYVMPEQKGWTKYEMTDERTEFRLSGDPTALVSFLPGYGSSFEQRYHTEKVSDIKEDTLIQLPVTFQYGDSAYLAITEAALTDYAGMSLIKHNGILESQLTPLPGEPAKGDTAIKVRATLPHQSPWRVLLISDHPGALIGSNIITSLNEPNRIKDTSWIRPGKTDFHWWNGDISPDTTFAPGINFDFNKYYIDFCASQGLEYHTVIGYANRAWYTNDATGYAPDPDTHPDVTRPVPGLDMQQICDYAKSKGVGIRVWVHWQALYAQLDKAFAQFEQWGIKGMMVDFMNRDDQEMVNIQTEILQKAAAHHLEIQFHGAYKPTGLNRTYPNEFTREGTLNYENDKWDDPITPDDDISIPFTRLLAGPADYHLGGFRAATDKQYKAQYTRPLVLGTRCHMLAMYVVLENEQGMVCDYPDAYLGQPGFDFIREVPVSWDETKVPAAKVSQYVCIARRKGNDWYVGAINNSTERTISIRLDFLQPGGYEAEIYADAKGENPNTLVQTTQYVQPGDVLTLHLASGGGQAIRIKPR
ncbi:MAG TPA: glycoside hydrolase family 97 protein [Dinghuibacter sp.]|uniref:glycoside hydrolase family 97 protein n=1 Tax=Dinghuibacter sp. TaxID=2024697 RepID=UPI002C554A4D|nr:glycoside hydrolase family 97 protein [Dinghuibacter sp.]HTJ11309.1 glycoside hydrolase family 97 protein [Dinghuibacter sp.]